MTLFGTRPEVIKLAPVIAELEARPDDFRTVNVTSAQHTDLLYPFVRLFDIRLDYDLKVMEANQTPSGVCAKVLNAIDPILSEEAPDLILVQGDTTTAFAGAFAGFYHSVPVGHVEAGLRSGNVFSPWPEEMNRMLISRLASFNFAATEHNRRTLAEEGVRDEAIFVTGNPVVDSLRKILAESPSTPAVDALLEKTRGRKRVVLTTHRRESLGELMARNMEVLRAFVDRHDELALIFPVHPNPRVTDAARAILADHERVHLIDPLGYPEFIRLLAEAWLIVSDSGGVQEEAPSLGKPLLVLRENTERPEAIEAGFARLVGGRPERLEAMLEEAYRDGVWTENLDPSHNPFGRGDAGKRIVDAIAQVLS